MAIPLPTNVQQAAERLGIVVKTIGLPFAVDHLPAGTALVGGAVRDGLLGRLTTRPDLDLTVPSAAIPLCQHLAAQFGGTVVVLDQQRDIGRWVQGAWIVDVAAWDGDTLAADLARRDFALNAMAYALHTRQLHDPCGGLSDLALRRLRCISPANLAADPLRVLRAYRLAAELDGTIDTGTRQWLRDKAPALGSVAAERVLAELERLCHAASGHRWLQAALDDGALGAWFPREAVPGTSNMAALDMTLAKALGLSGCHRVDVVALARLSALLPLDNTERSTVAQTLCCSRLRQRQLLTLGRWQHRFRTAGGNLDETHHVQLHLDLAADLPALLLLLLADQQLSMTQARVWLDRWQNRSDPLGHPRCPMDGHALQQALSLPPGPYLGQLMAFLRQEHAFGRLDANASAVIRRARQWMDDHPLSS